MISGFLIVNKEPGFTSHDVVAVVRGIAGQKKVGHTGTLDPDASGVLPVCLGKATKASAYMSAHEKTYETEMLLGKETDTQDISGEVLREAKEEEVLALSEERLRSVIASFAGESMQLPPMYSAKKVGGKKLYELARKGIETERKPVRIFLSEIEVLSVDLPRVRLRITCSGGTYIRTICHDIGKALGVGACMAALVRTKVNRFVLEEARTLSELSALKEEGRLMEAVIPIDAAFSDLPAVCCDERMMRQLLNGAPVRRDQTGPYTEAERVRMYDCEGRFFGIYEREGIFWKAEQIFADLT